MIVTLISIAVCILTPLLLLFLVQQNKREHLLILFLMLGILASIISTGCNMLFMDVTGLNSREMAIYWSPVLEEVFKALPILVICIITKPSFKELLGLAVAVGVGFATLENIEYLITATAQSGGIDPFIACLRGLSTGIMHAMTSALLATALSFVSRSKLSFILAAVGCLTISALLHGIYNLLLNGEYVYIPQEIMYVAYWLPITLAVAFLIALLVVYRRRRRNHGSSDLHQ